MSLDNPAAKHLLRFDGPGDGPGDTGAATPSRFLLECGNYSFTPTLGELAELNPFEASFHKVSSAAVPTTTFSGAPVAASAAIDTILLRGTQPAASALSSAAGPLPAFQAGLTEHPSSIVLGTGPTDSADSHLAVQFHQQAAVSSQGDGSSSGSSTATFVEATAAPQLLMNPVMAPADPAPRPTITATTKVKRASGRSNNGGQHQSSSSTDKSSPPSSGNQRRRSNSGKAGGAGKRNGNNGTGTSRASRGGPASTPPSTPDSNSESGKRPRSSPDQGSGAEDDDDERGADGQLLTPEQKRRRFLERNRIAASKCRQKKKQWIEELKRQSEAAVERNKQLNSIISTLKEEVLVLKNQLLAHRDCSCKVIQDYVGNPNNFASMTTMTMPVGNPAAAVLLQQHPTGPAFNSAPSGKPPSM
ncbi:hypothetical protein IWQ60_008146 [Tieghemiomyces parasiticus]|uniref:BZIP domain-containing protein n=1 Tax=Tieghemiomyces parasiticus TaxID=78921 RepID=A0A9W7ZZ36_9FUNG|nr:hypothetical protein IWQ60_008146 [Tieghemiomyces parasiticus]